ncbi:MAG TPA: 2-dehydropantoate 2-reductase [Gemmatimonadales bacterium]|nr:2-dehydropantoate 2-reductase [Gemmatimonadales bacterium]
MIAVFGTGAVGAYFGGRLAEAGADVSFVARGAHLRAIRERGLRVTSVAGDFTIHPARASDDPAELGGADVILLGVKTWQVAEAARAMRPMLKADTFVVPLLNGVEAPDQLTEALGAGRALGGLCHIYAEILEPGHIRHGGVEPYVAFGELDGRPSSPRAERLRDAFATARGVTAEVLPDVRAAMWRKLVFISAMSGVGAVTRAPMGVLTRLPETRQMLERAMEETRALAVQSGAALPASVVAETLAFMDKLPEHTTASMQRDIMAGRPSELDSQSGAVVRLAARAGVEVPVHDFIYRSLLPLELRARGTVRFAGE